MNAIDYNSMSDSEDEDTFELPDTLTLTSVSPTPTSPTKKNIWGRLVTRRAYLNTVDLYNERYILGRKDTCDIKINGTCMHPKYLEGISKSHFAIGRNSNQVPYIEDLSKNGTFINGSVLGKGHLATLSDGDIIALGWKQFEVYQFKDEVNVNVSEQFDRKYKLERFLGSGSFGDVYLIYCKRSRHKYAMKRIRCDNEKQVTNEVTILERLNHPFIIHMEDVLYDSGYVSIVLEYMRGGELHERVITENHLSESLSKLYLYQMLSAVRYLHQHGITHRDLKPENVLLASCDPITVLKVTDFGLSKVLGASRVMRSLCGTPLYAAPEILRCVGALADTYTPLVDVWSLGCILYFMLVGRTPFQLETTTTEMSIKRLFAQIRNGKYAVPEGLAKDAKLLIRRMLVVDPDQRITLDEIFHSKWFEDDMEMQRTIDNLLTSSSTT